MFPDSKLPSEAINSLIALTGQAIQSVMYGYLKEPDEHGVVDDGYRSLVAVTFDNGKVIDLRLDDLSYSLAVRIGLSRGYNPGENPNPVLDDHRYPSFLRTKWLHSCHDNLHGEVLGDVVCYSNDWSPSNASSTLKVANQRVIEFTLKAGRSFYVATKLDLQSWHGPTVRETIDTSSLTKLSPA